MCAIISMVRDRKAGVTLIEILVVLLILALVSIMMLPALTTFTKSIKIRSTTTNVVSLLRHTRRLAITKNQIYHCHIDFANGVAGVYPNAPTAAAPSDDDLEGKKLVISPSVHIANIHDSSGVVQTSPLDIVYHPSGSMISPNRKIYIHIANKIDSVDCSDNGTRMNAYTIKLSSLTGQVKQFTRGICCGQAGHWADET